MDPYFQRQICPSFYHPNNRNLNSFHASFPGMNFRLTSTPANNYVTPGIGQITKLYTFYTPLTSQKPSHAIEKQITSALNQEGAGKSEEESR
jgi:hypothetical protein